MNFSSIFSNRSSVQNQFGKNDNLTKRRLSVEQLEDRRLLSVNACTGEQILPDCLSGDMVYESSNVLAKDTANVLVQASSASPEQTAGTDLYRSVKSNTGFIEFGSSDSQNLKDIDNVSLYGYTGYYDGKEHTVTLVDPDIETDTVVYSYDGQSYDAAPAFSAVGTYPISVTVYRDGYNPWSQTKMVVIRAQKLIEDVTYEGYIGYYDGQEHTVTLYDPQIDTDIVVYTYDGVDYEEPPAFKEVGSYPVTVTVNRGSQYAEWVKTESVIIRALGEIEDVTLEGWTNYYDGQYHSVILNDPHEDIDTITYYYQGQAYSELPVFREVGVYSVTVIVKRPGYYDWGDTQEVRILALMPITDVAVRGWSGYYDGQSHSVAVYDPQAATDTILYTYNGITSNVNPAFSAPGTYEVTVTVQRKNYRDWVSAAVVEIKELEPITDVYLEDWQGYYDGKTHTIKVIDPQADTDTITYYYEGREYADLPAFVNVGSYSVDVVVQRKNCYDWTGSASVTILPLKEITDVSLTGWSGYYDGEGHTVTINDPHIDTDVVFYTYNGVRYDNAPLFFDAGYYTVYATVQRENCHDWTGAAVVEILPKQQITDVKVTGWTGYYDGKSHSVTVEDPSADSDTILYTYNGRTTKVNPSFVEEGTYAVGVTVKRENYFDLNQTAYVTILPLKEITDVSLSGWAGYYDGKSHTVTLIDPFAATDKIAYYYNDVKYSEAPAFTDPGEYSVTVVVSRENCNDWVGTADVKIWELKEITDVSVSGWTGYYDGKPHTVTVNDPQASTDTIYYTYNGSTTLNAPSFTDVGAYTVNITVTRENSRPWTGSAVVTINPKKEITDVTVTPWTGYYDGYKHSVTVNNVRATDTVLYTYNGETYKTNPAFTEVGVYKVGVTVQRENCNDWTTQSTVTVMPLEDITDAQLTGWTGYYDGNPHSAVLIDPVTTDTVVWYYNSVAYSESPAFIEPGYYSVSVKVSREGYNDWYSATQVVILKKQTIEDVALLGWSGTYDGQGHTVTLVDPKIETDTVYYTYNGEVYANPPYFKNVGTYQVTAFVSRDGYYDWSQTSTVSIQPALITDVSLSGWYGTYDGNEHTVTLTDPKAATDTIIYTYNGKQYATAPAFTEPGSYAVSVSVQRENYAEWTQTAYVNIKELSKITDVTLTGWSGYYDGKTHSVTLADPKAATDTITYYYNGQAYAASPKFIEPGEYEVSVVVSRDGYSDWSDTKTVTIYQLQDITDVTVEGWTGYYDGASHTVKVTDPQASTDTIIYYYNGKAYSSAPGFILAGTYPVTVKVQREGCKDWSTTVNVDVLPIKLITDVSISNWSGRYDGQPHSITVNDPYAATDTILYTWNGKTSAELPQFTEVGSWVVTVTVKREHYTDWVGTGTVTIYPLSNISDVTLSSWVGYYDGKSHTITVNDPNYQTDTILYTYQGKTSQEIPEFTDVGAYAVGVTVKRDGFNDWTGTATVNILPLRDITDVSVSGWTGWFDGKGHSIFLSDPEAATDTILYTYNGVTTSELPVFVYAGNYKVDVTVKRQNCNDWTGSASVLIMEQPVIEGISLDGWTGYYDGKSHSITVSGQIASTDTILYVYEGRTYNTNPAFTEVGQYNVGVIISRDNYQDWTGSAAVTILPLKDIIDVSVTGWYGTEDGKSHTVTLNDPQIATDTVRYIYGGQTYTTSPAFSAPGTYTVNVIVQRENCNDWYGTADVTILAKKEITDVFLTGWSGYYDGQAHTVSLIDPMEATDTILYWYNGQASITAPLFVEPGNYPVTVTISREGYNDWVGTAEVRIMQNQTITDVVLVGWSGYYDGKSHSVTVVDPYMSTDTILYTYNGQTSTSAPNFVDAGTYEVTVTVKRSTYNDWVGSAKVEILPAKITDVSVSGWTGHYDGNSHTITVNDPQAATDTIIYTYKGQSYSTLPSFKDVGIYEIGVTVSRKNYTDWTGSASVVILQKKDIVDVSVSGWRGFYDGEQHTVTVNDPQASTDTILYTYNGQTTAAAPKFINTGVYNVTVTVKRENCNDWVGSASVEILPASIANVSVTGWKGYYDGQKHTVTVNDPQLSTDTVLYTYNGQTTTTAPEFVDAGTYSVTVTVKRSNYNDWVGTAKVEIIPAVITDVSLEGWTGYYDGNFHTITVNDPQADTDVILYKYNGKTYSTLPAFNEIGTYEVGVTVSRKNYADWTGSATVNILQKQDILDVSVTGWEGYYDGHAHTVTVTDPQAATDTILYTYNGQTTAAAPMFTDSGTYSVKVTVQRENCKDWVGSAIVNIIPAKITDVSVEDWTGYYDGYSHTITVNDPQAATDTIVYTYNGKTYSTLPSFSNVGSYVIGVTVSRKNYADWTGSATVTILPKQEILDVSVTGWKGYYDGQPHTVTVNDPQASTDIILYTYKGETTSEAPEFTKVGTYSVTVTVQRENCNDWVGTAAVEILPAMITDVSVEGWTGYYDGQQHTVTVNDPQSSTDTILYTYNGQTSIVAPRFINVGTYNVVVVVQRENFNDWTGTAVVEILPVAITDVSVSGWTGYYDGESHTITVNDPQAATDTITYTYGGKVYSTIPSFVNVGTYEVGVTVSRKNHTDWVGSATVTILPKKDILDVSVEGWTGYYDGKPHTITVIDPQAETDEIYYTYNGQVTTIVPTFTKVGSYTVTVTVKRENCNDWVGSADVNILTTDLPQLDVLDMELTSKYDPGKVMGKYALPTDTIIMNFSIKNIGKGNVVYPFYDSVIVYDSQGNVVIDLYESVFRGNYDTTGYTLKAGETGVHSIQAGQFAVGTYKVVFTADSRHTVETLDRSLNVGTFYFTVVTKWYDLEATGISVCNRDTSEPKYIFSKNEPVAVDWSFMNTGGIDIEPQHGAIYSSVTLKKKDENGDYSIIVVDGYESCWQGELAVGETATNRAVLGYLGDGDYWVSVVVDDRGTYTEDGACEPLNAYFTVTSAKYDLKAGQVYLKDRDTGEISNTFNTTEVIQAEWTIINNGVLDIKANKGAIYNSVTVTKKDEYGEYSIAVLDNYEVAWQGDLPSGETASKLMTLGVLSEGDYRISVTVDSRGTFDPKQIGNTTVNYFTVVGETKKLAELHAGACQFYTTTSAYSPSLIYKAKVTYSNQGGWPIDPNTGYFYSTLTLVDKATGKVVPTCDHYEFCHVGIMTYGQSDSYTVTLGALAAGEYELTVQLDYREDLPQTTREYNTKTYTLRVSNIDTESRNVIDVIESGNVFEDELFLDSLCCDF